MFVLRALRFLHVEMKILVFVKTFRSREEERKGSNNWKRSKPRGNLFSVSLQWGLKAGWNLGGLDGTFGGWMEGLDDGARGMGWSQGGWTALAAPTHWGAKREFQVP